MARFSRRSFIALGFALALLMPPFTLADWSSPDATPADPDYAAGIKAVEAKDWNQAAEHLNKAAARNDKDANIFNLLGYSERNRGNMDAAFAAYDKALKLDPKHKGAHAYVGEGYLKVGNLPKAEEHLAALDKICTFGCKEYKSLKEKVAEYKAGKK